ncbi:predicted protein [Phaeodactylum tricornutum CCAP 1055/1]|jgi:hypothetical protein|uniref:Uncharacterized protein n=2 Tax=Phaeodactylum tricornutum TaxID=2850 RepID=B7G299_PHATC|nr:predicted protein [Phaeodactylum tricornutum CCAP 1055/1]EEC47096.1 predicted protein [Phaeodactylum tricornutum CCAP 1055/1]|eukprot:XP_002181173.1 predicted protein [Phaeodactylum tricornutum CCAP 1055/1]
MPGTGNYVRLVSIAVVIYPHAPSVQGFVTELRRGFLPTIQTGCSSATSLLAYHPLSTALEQIANERSIRDSSYRKLSWLDPTTASPRLSQDIAVDKDASQAGPNTASEEVLPLYPLQAVYVPTETSLKHSHFTNYTLNNVEPRNIRMALDLWDNKTASNRRFCSVLRCVDSGRLATIGTVLRIVALETQYGAVDPTIVLRVIVKCVAEELVEIAGIENPEAATQEARLLGRPEYLQARIKKRTLPEEADDFRSGEAQWLVQFTQDYHAVRNFYLGGVGTKDIPHFALSTVEDSLPIWTEADFTPCKFWQIAETWQRLCYTVREGRQIMLSSNRNELMVTAALGKGGPLQLPIHMEDLSVNERQAIQTLEEKARDAWLELRLDPCMDFQILIALPTHHERVAFLANLVSRERRRLTELALSSPIEKRVDETSELPRKGAWFFE